MKPFRHEQNHDVKVDIPTQDLEDLAESIGSTVIVVIGFYMAADTARHILKSLFK
jgi:hypothetical protein